MQRTINIKGVGTANAKPDYVEIHLNLETLDKYYPDAYSRANKKIAGLTKILQEAGFESTDLKTSSFQIEAKYSSYRDRNDNYVRRFDGYNIEHKLKLAFNFESDRLSKALDSISNSEINPKIQIRFTVKDPTDIKEDLLISAAKNAKRKAEILCQASEARLGELLSIHYNWSEIDVFSKSDYDIDAFERMEYQASMLLEPEDITLRDTADFIWEIK